MKNMTAILGLVSIVSTVFALRAFAGAPVVASDLSLTSKPLVIETLYVNDGSGQIDARVAKIKDSVTGTVCYVAYTKLDKGEISEAASIPQPSISCVK